MDYEPVPCKNCGGILNPFASCDFTAHLWICPLCFGRNHFPAQYNGINEQMLPAELFQEYTTIEYRLPALKPVYAPAYVFVVDTCLSEEELNASQGAISQALQMIPEYARVALVTFGTHVQVYELGFDVLNKSYVFQGSKEYTAQQVQSQLGIGASTASRQPASPSRPGMKAQQLQDPIAFAARRFILPVSECEFTISAAIEGLRKDAFPSVADHRPSRCTGTAIQVTSCFIRSFTSCSARRWLQMHQYNSCACKHNKLNVKKQSQGLFIQLECAVARALHSAWVCNAIIHCAGCTYAGAHDLLVLPWRMQCNSQTCCKSAMSHCFVEHDRKLLPAQQHPAMPSCMTKPEPTNMVLMYTFCGRCSAAVGQC